MFKSSLKLIMAGLISYKLKKQLSTQLNVENLLDKTYYGSLALDSQAYGKPRKINLNLSYQF